jgi:hypothetical protein
MGLAFSILWDMNIMQYDKIDVLMGQIIRCIATTDNHNLQAEIQSLICMAAQDYMGDMSDDAYDEVVESLRNRADFIIDRYNKQEYRAEKRNRKHMREVMDMFLNGGDNNV